jgi:uncharacterized protein (DUF1810 family)
MTTASNPRDTDDPFELSRFLDAQDGEYSGILAEIQSGRKRSHWMWYVFPQIDGLAFSSTSQRFAIKSIDEAQAYLKHPILGARLLECAKAVVEIEGRSVAEIFGSPDDLKLRSSATLFAAVSEAGSVFERILEKYYHGERDERTVERLQKLNA